MADEEKVEKPKPKSKPKRKVVTTLEEAVEVGYLGNEPDREYDVEEYALTSGPDSPPYPLGKGK